MLKFLPISVRASAFLVEHRIFLKSLYATYVGLLFSLNTNDHKFSTNYFMKILFVEMFYGENSWIIHDNSCSKKRAKRKHAFMYIPSHMQHFRKIV